MSQSNVMAHRATPIVLIVLGSLATFAWVLGPLVGPLGALAAAAGWTLLGRRIGAGPLCMMLGAACAVVVAATLVVAPKLPNGACDGPCGDSYGFLAFSAGGVLAFELGVFAVVSLVVWAIGGPLSRGHRAGS